METSSSSVFWSVLVAAIGGAIVFIGLLLEKIAEYKAEQYLRKSCHGLSTAGWCLLMIGIAVEFVVASCTALHEWKHDPLNRPIQSVTAQVSLMVRGTNGLTFNPGHNLNDSVFSKMLIGNMDTLIKSPSTNRDWDLGMGCTSARSEIFGDAGGLITVWSLQFEQNAAFPDSTVKTLHGRDAEKWNTVVLNLMFIPAGTEITGGRIKLVATPVSSMSLPIPRQVAQTMFESTTFSENSVTVVGPPGILMPKQK